jgi:hypothetical protein
MEQPDNSDNSDGKGPTLHDALVDASEKAKRKQKGWYRVIQIDVDVQDSIHEYKVIIGPTP